MKQVHFEDEGSCGVCPILEDIDLQAMTDEQIHAELSNWLRQAYGDDPLENVVEDNIRLVRRHIELRDMSDEELNRAIEKAEWYVDFISERIKESDCAKLRSVGAQYRRQAEQCRRELVRRADLEVDAAEDELSAEVDGRTDVVMSFPWKNETAAYLRDLATRANQLAVELGYCGVVWSVRTISLSLSGGRVRFGNMDDAINASRSVLAALVGDSSPKATELRKVVHALDHRLCDLEVEGQIVGYGNAI